MTKTKKRNQQIIVDKNIEREQKLEKLTENRTVKKIQADLSNYDAAVLVFISDWHIGTVDFDINKAKKVLDYVLQTPNARLFVLGDMMNTAIKNSKSDSYEDINTAGDQWKIVNSLLKQVANQGKIVVVHEGNHERRIKKEAGVSTVDQECEALGIPDKFAPYYADTTVKLKYFLKNSSDMFKMADIFSFNIVTHHGESKKPENNATINENSTINVIGHIHRLKSFTRVKLINSNGRIVKRDEINITLPAAGGGNYGSELGYKPIYMCHYYAMEVTVVPNHLYNPEDPNNKEEEYILATKSLSILDNAPTTYKEECVNEIDKVIKNEMKKFKAKTEKITEQIVEAANEVINNTTIKGVEAISKIKKDGQPKSINPYRQEDRED